MREWTKLLGCLTAGAMAFAAMPSCRDRQDSVRSDLEAAGYQLTSADWFRAIRANDVPALKKFIAGGFAPDSKDDSGDSGLHAAAAAGARDSADFLLNKGLGIDGRGAAGRTPLMAAILGNQTTLVRWLIRQGADPRVKDDEGFTPLMIAVREGKSGSVAELAPHQRENLDAAILLAALLGQSQEIDTLTQYGASVYAKMEDGRTPLMVAAQNGHTDAVKLLLDLGSSRFSSDSAGKTASDLATEAGHAEIAELISREPLPEDFALETPAQVAEEMESFVDAAIAEAPAQVEQESPGGSAVAGTGKSAGTSTQPLRRAAATIEGATLSRAVSPTPDSAVVRSVNPSQATALPASSGSAGFPHPPLVMRHYREREIPVRVETVEGATATLSLGSLSKSGGRVVKLQAGDSIPGTRLEIIRVQRRMKDSKLNLGQAMEVSVVEVRDTSTQSTRKWISGVPAIGHDPVALVEDAASGQRYTATPGQRFKSEDGAEFIITDVRPNQLIIEDAATGAVQTIPLRGPRG